MFGFVHGLFWTTLLSVKPATRPPRPTAKPAIASAQQMQLLAAVCPEVRQILAAELRAGNRIVSGGIGGDWPWPDSTIISLGSIFQSEP